MTPELRVFLLSPLQLSLISGLALPVFVLMQQQAIQACEQATSEVILQGNVGAGTGATVGKMAGPSFMMKGGLGSASTLLSDGTLVGALVVVNALGDIIDPHTQRVVAGTRNPSGQGFLAANCNG